MKIKRSTDLSPILLLFFLCFLLCFSFELKAQTFNSNSEEWDVNNAIGEYNTSKIKVTEGTWMNLDISPDGKNIVFDLLGDIYIISSSGGKAKLLTSDLAWQMQPKFSPDSKLIAFTSDEGGGENIWIMDIQGRQKRAVTNEDFRMLNSPSWSPDGNYIVARKHFTATRSLGAGEIWMYHLAGGNGIQLTKRPNQEKDMGEPVHSPDGRYVYYSQDITAGDRFEYSKDSEKGIYAIKRLELDTGEIEEIVSGRGGAIRPTPSPDGTQLAYISRVDFQSTLFNLDLRTGISKPIYNNMDQDKQESWAIHGVYPSMSWTSDNQHLLFWAGGKINKLHVGEEKVHEINFEVNTEKVISKTLRFSKNIDSNDFEVKMLRNVSVSPDGKQVVFEALGYIYIRNLPNGEPKRLTKQKSHLEYDPMFSRDGQKIVYTTWNDIAQGNIRVVSSKTGEGKNLLTQPGKYIEACFSPSGSTVVFRKFNDNAVLDPNYNINPGIYQVPAIGGEARLITKHGRMPHFADRNDRIYVHRDNEAPTLARVDLDGNNDKVVYKIKYATEFKMAPNGKHLAFVANYKVKITPYIESGEPIIINQEETGTVKNLSVKAGTNISFDKNSDIVFWNLGPDLYQRATKNYLDTDNKEDSEIVRTPISFSQKFDKSSGVVAFVGGQVVTMEEDGVIQNGVVLIEGNHITAVGRNGQINIPSNAKIIDITGKTIIPGIIDTHAHQLQGSNGIIPQQNWNNFATTTFGVTTLFNPNTKTSEIFAVSEMQKAGHIIAPRIFSTGMSLYGAYEPGHTAIVNSLDDARFHIERLKKVGAFAIKMHHQPRREQYQQIIHAAREHEIMVLSEGGALLQQDLGKIADGASSIEHSLSLAKIYEDVYQFWEQSQTASIPTLVVSFGGISGEHYWYAHTDVWKHPRLSKYVPQKILAPRAMRRMVAPEHHYNHFNVVKIEKKMNDRGILIGIGGHGQREGLAAHWEMWMMVQGGMTPLEAIGAATINPAKHLGLDRNIGSLKVGKMADLVVIDGDIVKDIRQSDKVIYVMLNGRLYDAESMNELGANNKKRDLFYFE